MSEVRFRMYTLPRLLTLVALQLFTASARADEPSPKAQARAHFQSGLVLAARGELQSAIDAFENAYHVSPHYAVLYNLGQAYGAMGRSLEAVQTLERFLLEGGAQLDTGRRGEVQALIARERARLGRAEFDVSPAGAEVFLDGRNLGPGPFQPMELAAGLHVITVRKEGYLQRSEPLQLAPGESTRVRVSLEPVRILGILGVRCDVPDVEVRIEGERRGVTPLRSPLLLAVGSKTVTFTREGYVPSTKTANIQETQATEVDCNVAPDPRAQRRGRIRISPSEPLAKITIDGKPHQTDWLPSGLHTVHVERDGFLPWRQQITLEDGQQRELAVILQPTDVRMQETDAARRRQRTWALGVGVGGLVVAGSAATLFAWNTGRYDEWRTERDSVDEELSNGNLSTDLGARNSSLGRRAAEIQRVDDLALGMAFTAGASLLTAGILWITAQ